MRTLTRQGTERAVSPQRRGPRWRIASWRLSARKAAISGLGFGALALGVALTLTPFPSAIFVLLGLALLAREYAWARRLLVPGRQLVQRVAAFLRHLVLRPVAIGAGSR